LKKHLIDSGRCENLSDAIQLGLRCFLDEYFNYPDEPPELDGPSKFMYHLEKLRKKIKESGGLFPGKSSEEVIEILRETRRKIIYSPTYDVPEELIDKYQAELGLKSEDALIAAFAEWKGIHILVSDNRHFYEELKVEQFVICNAIEQLEAKMREVINGTIRDTSCRFSQGAVYRRSCGYERQWYDGHRRRLDGRLFYRVV